MYKTVLFQTIQLNTSTQSRSIRSIDWTLSDATIPGKSGPGSDDNKGVLYITQSSKLPEDSASDSLETYPGQSLEKLYSSAEMQSVYFATPDDCAIFKSEGSGADTF